MKRLITLVLFVALIAAGLTLPVHAQLPPGYPIDTPEPRAQEEYIEPENCVEHDWLGFCIEAADSEQPSELHTEATFDLTGSLKGMAVMGGYLILSVIVGKLAVWYVQTK